MNSPNPSKPRVFRFWPVVLVAAIGGVGAWVYASQGLSGEFSGKPNAVAECPADFFVASARVFDAMQICATEGVPQAKLAYAANVAAAWLDNDLDGQADAPEIVKGLQESSAVLLMSKAGFSSAAFAKVALGLDANTGVGQDLSAAETNPEDRRDASQEEIHHLIVNGGWAKIYPNVFSDTPDVSSEMFKQWETAEAEGYYNYNDPTCDAACKSVEFHYLAAAAYLGSAADLASDEMRLKTRDELAGKLPGVIDIFQSNRYTYPIHRWPDGTYPHAQNIVMK